MTISPPTAEGVSKGNAHPAGQRLLEQLERFTTRDDGQVAVGRRLLADHPDLPLFGFAISHSIEPEPGEPAHSLILRVGEDNTDAITAWAKALGTEPVIDGARHTLTAVMDGIGIWAAATIPEAEYDMDQAVFTPTGDDVSGTYRGLLATWIGEDGDLLIVGHPPVRDVLAATSYYYRDTCGQRLCPYDGHDLADSIDRRWGRFVAYPTRTEWQIRSVPEDTPGAVPVTWVHAQDGHTQDLGDVEHCPTCGRPSRGLAYDPVNGRASTSAPHPPAGTSGRSPTPRPRPARRSTPNAVRHHDSAPPLRQHRVQAPGDGHRRAERPQLRLHRPIRLHRPLQRLQLAPHEQGRDPAGGARRLAPAQPPQHPRPRHQLTLSGGPEPSHPRPPHPEDSHMTGITGRTYLERGNPITVITAYNARRTPDTNTPWLHFTWPGRRPAAGPRNVAIRRADGSTTIRPFRGLTRLNRHDNDPTV